MMILQPDLIGGEVLHGYSVLHCRTPHAEVRLGWELLDLPEGVLVDQHC